MMKTLNSLLLIPAFVTLAWNASAQETSDTSYWHHTGKAGLNFSQVGLSHWAAGGDPSISYNGILNYALKYERGAHLWQTTLDAGYGVQRIGKKEEPFKKTDDNVVLMTRYGYRIAHKWYLSALASFRTQFDEGYSYSTDPATLISNFMAPAYSKVGIGITYSHNFSETESFSFTFNPVNGKMTLVLDDTLSARGEFGVDPGNHSRFQGGLDLTVALNKELLKNITLKTTLTAFSSYSDLAVVDMNWDMALWFRINEFFSANISTQLVYDQDVAFVNDAGQTIHSEVQFKEVLGIGLTYSF